MKPRGVLVAALLLVVIVVDVIVAWAIFGDRPGPMNFTEGFRLEATLPDMLGVGQQPTECGPGALG